MAFGGAFTDISAEAVSQLSPSAQVGFETNLNDHEVKALLDEYDVTPKAAFIWTSGLTSTHREYKTLSNDRFLEKSLSGAIGLWEKGIQGNAVRAKMFADRYSENEVIGSVALTSDARSLLQIREQLESALTEAKTGAALIYGAEVVGDNAELDRLRADPAVRFFIDRSKNTDIKDSDRRGVKPEQYRDNWIDSSLEEMGARDLYRAIQQAGNVEPSSR
jgi:hypothetical protein